MTQLAAHLRKFYLAATYDTLPQNVADVFVFDKTIVVVDTDRHGVRRWHARLHNSVMERDASNCHGQLGTGLVVLACADFTDIQLAAVEVVDPEPTSTAVTNPNDEETQ